MDEALKKALHEAGTMLAEHVGHALRDAGIPCAIERNGSDGRTRLSLKSRQLVRRELGAMGVPPQPLLPAAIQLAMPSILQRVKAILEG